MSGTQIDLKEFHWMMDALQSIDVGLIVLDRNYHVQMWNSFMQNHSGIMPADAHEQVIFDLFPQLPQDWFKHKIDSVFLLNNRAFTVWEQRPHVFPFRNYQPITGTEAFMYQNTSMIPLSSTDGKVNHVCVIIYDMTDAAVNKKGMLSANGELERLSRTDMLTQLNNRGFWEECLANEYKRFKRTGGVSTLVMFDIDHFKKVNDTYGHQAGDEVIRRTSKLLRDNMRETDVAGRYGGEEFGVILVNTDAENALVFTERLRKAIEASMVAYEGWEIKYTVSLGLAQISEDSGDYKGWLEQADKALYACKENGRNQSRVFGQ